MYLFLIKPKVIFRCVFVASIWLGGTHFLFAQEQIKIPLTPTVGYEFSRLIIPRAPIYSTDGYNGLDTAKYKVWQLYNYWFNGDQELHDSFGGMKTLLQHGIDTTYIYSRKIPRNRIACFVGLDSAGWFHAAFDTNNNRDFSDDTWYRLPYNPSTEKFASDSYQIPCSFTYFDGKQLLDTAIVMEMELLQFPKGTPPADHYRTMGRLNGVMEARLMKMAYQKGRTVYKGNEYLFFVEDEYYSLYKRPRYYTFRMQKGVTDSVGKYYRYDSKSDELLRLGADLYSFPKQIQDTLVLTFIREALQGNAAIGSTMPGGKAVDLITNKLYSFGEGNGHYTVIDFWASWCGPCIRSLPALKELHDRYQTNGVQVISLAIDKPANKQKLLDLIQQYQLDWPQLFMDDKGEGDRFLKATHIQHFPTTILLDPEGKVLYRAVSIDAVHKVDERLKEIFK